MLFLGLYLAASTVALPRIAPHFGREALPCFAGSERHLQAQSIVYCLANRNYVRPQVKLALRDIADKMAERFPGTTVTYFDANFPFADGFPLLPHLSHKDGRKLDLALFYQGRKAGGAWPFGYWAFTQPPPRTDTPCARDGLLRWNMAWLQPLLPAHSLDDSRTRGLIETILAKTPQKILLEPHLVRRLHLEGRGILFAGCHAARHDDHVHIQW